MFVGKVGNGLRRVSQETCHINLNLKCSSGETDGRLDMKRQVSTVLAGILGFTPFGAFAHHPMGGAPLETFAHGLLSGIGHPILGFDHLFFVVLVGVAALYTGRRYFAPAAYITAMLAGCLMMSTGIGLPAKEVVIGFSLLMLGSVVLSGRGMTLVPALFVFAAFGLFHGSAFGDVLAGREAAVGSHVLIGYLIGLGVIQYAISIAAGWMMVTILRATDAKAIEARLAGAVVTGVGLFLTMENMEGLLFDLMGWAS